MKNLKYCFAAFALATIFTACEKTELDNIVTSPDEYGDPVSVGLSLSITPIEQSGTATRADASNVITPIACDEDGIFDLWVLQFDGSDDDSKFITSCYIPDYQTFITSSDGNDNTITLIPTPADTEHTIVYIANTGRSQLGFGDGSTYLDAKELKSSIKSMSACLPSYNGTNYITMSAEEQVEIKTSGSELKPNLQRSLAKINFTITPEASSGLEFFSAQLCAIPQYNYFFLDRELPDLYPDNSYVFDDEVVSITNEITNYSASEAVTIVYYMPINKKGDVDNSTAYTCPLYAPTGSTYITLFANVTDGGKDYVNEYVFHLGENLTTNFDIEPNKSYNYNITFTDQGSEQDLRITQYPGGDTVDLRGGNASNCYILNPSPSSAKSYIIPIESRVNDFWQNYSGENSKPINVSSDWNVRVLWYDCGILKAASTSVNGSLLAESAENIGQNQIFVEKADSENNSLEEGIKVTLGSGFEDYGNVLVYVYKATDTTEAPLWSWHLWITDYDPDNRTHYPEEGVYRYSVSNGEIVRFDTELWGTDGIYENSFMMDRNIGTPTEEDIISDTKSLVYEFGRKDPFATRMGKYYYYAASGNTAAYYKNVGVTKTIGYVASGASFVQSVQNLVTSYYMTNGEWCNEDAIRNASYLWNDVDVPNDAASVNYGEKSIFDPSPLGWKLPVWGFLTSTNCVQLDSYEVYKINNEVVAKFPLSGYQYARYGGSNWYNGAVLSYLWTATPYSTIQGRQYKTSNYNKEMMCPVRCVKE